MIDTYPFGGCNSSLEAFSLGRPVITQPSKLLNGRFTYGFYKKMEFMDIIANSKEEYVLNAVKLGTNKEYNSYCSSIIQKNNNKLFQEEKSYLDWKKLIEKEFKMCQKIQ
jgi:predicted O-linked N-acetylglucosamine transferase (SPINDLY family)